MSELGLFPLSMVLLPTERVPLHIFEPRYKELIGECLELDREFGLVLGDEDGVREVGTFAIVVEVLERFPDGRLNVLIEGRDRFHLLELTGGRSFATGEVEPLADDEEEGPEDADREHALDLFRKLAELVETDIDEPDEGSDVLSFELAARVDFGVDRKQKLLELRSEPERLRLVGELLEKALDSISLERELAERATQNGRGVLRAPDAG